jgi:hypothetical protein
MATEHSPLESLQDRVYSPSADITEESREYSHEDVATPYGWQAPPPPVPPKKRMPWTVWFLAATVAFLLLAGAVAAFLIFHGTRAISSDRVTITADAPVRIASGDTVSFVMTIHNDNPTTLSKATLFATFPEGTRAADGSDTPTQYNDVLGDIPAGGEVTRTVQIKLFGAENQSLSIPIRVEYRTEGSNALFVSEKEATVVVATSPISVQVQTLSQTPSGQPLTLSVIVRSNASTPLENIALTAQYPSGFTVRTTDPSQSGNNYFSLGTLAPGDQKTIKITGSLIGQNTDQRVFRFTAGSSNTNGTNTLGNTFAQGDATITVTHPFLNVGLTLNREATDSIVVEPGETVGANVAWQNMLNEALTNASIRIAVAGNALQPGSISGGTGFYRSQDSTVIFDSSTNSSFSSLSAGDTGAGNFSFAVRPAQSLVGVKNPTVTLTVSMAGQQTNQGTTPQTLNATLTRTIKVGTQVNLTSMTARSTGPIPPVAGSETTYKITLTAQNSVNSVGAAKVTFTLPSYVRWTGTADASYVYNPDTRTVVWNIGDIAAGAKALATFEVGITPSTSQRSTVPTLVSSPTFTGVDRFAQQQVDASAERITTELQGSSSSGTVN